MVGNLKVGDQIRQTPFEFRNMDEFEAYINAIDEGYDAEDAILNGYIYKLNTPQFKKVDRSPKRNDCDFKHEIIQYRGNTCFIPTKGYCFVKCNNFRTGQNYKQQNLDFIRNEKRRPNIMTKPRSQPFCRAKNINLGYFDGERVFPGSVTERNIALKIHKNHFCLKWKSEGISFNQAFTESKDNFKLVDNFITEENVKSHIEHKYKPKKLQSQLTNFIVFDLETLNTDRAKPYNMAFYRLSKISGRYERAPTVDELNKSKIDMIAIVGDNCVGPALDFCLKLKGEEYKD